VGGTRLADQPCEQTFLKFDVESDTSINLTLSGLTLGLHSHIGTTGFEDLILSLKTLLGAFDIFELLVFAQPYGTFQAPDGQIIPVCYEDAPGSGSCQIFFVQKRLEVTSLLGGLRLRNLVIIEDVNFPVPGAVKPLGALYTLQSQSFGFGDLLEISGQTSSGITVTGRTSICVQDSSNSIKKHTFTFTVNPDCVSGTQTPSRKPPLFFDFEELQITGFSLFPDLSMDFAVQCVGFSTCGFANTLTLLNVRPFSVITVQTRFDSVQGPFTFGNILVNLTSGSLTLIFSIRPTLEINSINAVAQLLLNPDANPAGLNISTSLSPGLGINSVVASFNVARLGMNFQALLTFAGGGSSFSFSRLVLKLMIPVAPINFEVNVAFAGRGFAGTTLRASVSF